MKKERIITYLFIVFLLGVFLLLFYFLDLRLTGFIGYEQLNESDFDEGIYYNTQYNGSSVILSEGSLSGTYTSKIFDGGSNSQWDSFSWDEILPTVLKTFTIKPTHAKDSWGQDISSKVNANDGIDTWERVEVQIWNDTIAGGVINSVIGYCKTKWIDTDSKIGFQVSRDSGTTWDSEICVQNAVAGATIACDLKTNSGVDSVGEINNLRMRCTFPTAEQNKYYSTDFVYVAINYTTSPTNLNFQARSCDDENCNEENWNNITGTSPQDLSLENNRYFQYKVFFETDDVSYTPEFQSVSIDYTTLNSPPTWILIPNQTWDEDTSLIIDLSEYSSDSDGDNLFWNCNNLDNITITIDNVTGIATVVPDANWFGTEYIVFTASDGKDSTDSNNIILIVNDAAESPTATSSSSGGGGGRGGGSSSITQTITSEQISEGYTKELKENEEIKFQIENADGKQEHSVSLNSVSGDEVTITIQSEPIIFTLKINESKKFDLSDDDYYDLYIKLEDIVNGKAKITIQTIHEGILRESKQEEKIENEQVGESKETSVTGQVSKITGAIIGFMKSGGWAVLIFIVLIIAFFVHLKKRKKFKKIKKKRNH